MWWWAITFKQNWCFYISFSRSAIVVKMFIIYSEHAQVCMCFIFRMCHSFYMYMESSYIWSILNGTSSIGFMIPKWTDALKLLSLKDSLPAQEKNSAFSHSKHVLIYMIVVYQNYLESNQNWISRRERFTNKTPTKNSLSQTNFDSP